MLNIFSCACWSSVCHFWRNVYLGLLPIFWLNSFFLFFLILSCMNCFGILEINLFLSAFFANVFSHSVGYLFILFMISPVTQKLLSLLRSYLCISAFVCITLGDEPKKLLLWFMLKSVLPVFSFRGFIVSGLTFRSLSFEFFFEFKFEFNFEFIFVCGVRECSSFILLHTVVQFSQHCLLKRRSFLRCVFLPSLSRLIGRKSRGCFWTVCPVPLMWLSVFVPVLYCFDYCSFGVYSEFGEHDSFTPVLLQDCFG